MCNDIQSLQRLSFKFYLHISVFLTDAEGYNPRVKNSAALYPYSTLDGDEKVCRSACDQDKSCNGYSTNSFDNTCFLSHCSDYTNVLECSTCLFSSKRTPSSSVSCSPATTTMTTTTALKTSTITISTNEVSISTDDVTNIFDTNNISCVCVCKFVNQTLQESMDNRRKKLTLNKTKLASTIRKLRSAPDFRMSSELIGVVATIVLAIIGLLCFCADVGYLMSLPLSIKTTENEI